MYLPFRCPDRAQACRLACAKCSHTRRVLRAGLQARQALARVRRRKGAANPRANPRANPPMPVASARVMNRTGSWPPTRAQFSFGRHQRRSRPRPRPRPCRRRRRRRRRRQVGQGRSLWHARARSVSPSLSLTRMPTLSLCRAGKDSTHQGACAAPIPAGTDPSKLAAAQAALAAALAAEKNVFKRKLLEAKMAGQTLEQAMKSI